MTEESKSPDVAQYSVRTKTWAKRDLRERRENEQAVQDEVDALVSEISDLIASSGDQTASIKTVASTERCLVLLLCTPDFAEKLKALPHAGSVNPVSVAKIDTSFDVMMASLKARNNDKGPKNN